MTKVDISSFIVLIFVWQKVVFIFLVHRLNLGRVAYLLTPKVLINPFLPEVLLEEQDSY